MSLFRSHILHVTVLILFVAGMIHLALPTGGRHGSAESVSSWLSGLRSNTSNSEVTEKIDALRTERSNIPDLLRKASGIINEHRDDFNIPVDTSNTSDDDIYHTLLIKWTLYQQNSSTSALMTAERQNQVPQATDKEDSTTWGQFTATVRLVIDAWSRTREAVEFVRSLLRPLSSGIAIGAP